MAITDYYNIVALVFFALFAIFVPVSFLIGSAMLRTRKSHNPTKGTPYESAEKPVGKNRDIVNEYLPYFVLFLPFEIIAVLLVIWASSAKGLPLPTNLMIIGLAIFSMVFAIVGFRITSGKNV